LNFKTEFNDRVRDEVWNKHHQSFTKYFFYALTHLKQIDDYYIPNNLLPPKVLESRIYRLELGYHGIGKSGGIPSKIMSKESSLLKPKDRVNDHVLGATEIGKYIHDKFKKQNCNIDWMVKNWLFENLYLWGTVKVTKEEHNPKNIFRNSDHTIEQKSNFEHYVNVSQLI
jgi:hypothetical protein